MPPGTLLHSLAELAWSWSQEHPAAKAAIVKLFQRPRLELTADIEHDREIRPLLWVGWVNGATISDAELGTVYRVRLENFGRSLATGCRVFIDTMTCNGRQVIQRELSNILSWKDENDFGPKALPPRIPTYVNVARIRADSTIIAFCTKANQAGDHEFLDSGEDVLRIIAEGVNFVSAGEITLSIHHDRGEPIRGGSLTVLSQRGQLRLS